ncbi:LytR/AlgR family response regulator transcription factor [Aliikangiella sp. IMCC44632]
MPVKDSNNAIRAIIVDDENLARESIRVSLNQYSDWDIVGECNRGDEVVTLVKQVKPDVVFLDINMPGQNGLTVCKALQNTPQPPFIIFVTAYDLHAVEAFELCALDYLLKPFDDQRFQQTLSRASEQIKHHEVHKKQVAQLTQVSSNANEILTTLIVRSVGKIQLVDVSDLLWVSTAGNYLELHLKEGVILHRVSLSYLEKHLSKQEFIRVHRTAMIRFSLVREFITVADGQYNVILSNGDQVAVSQTYKAELLKKLGIEQ